MFISLLACGHEAATNGRPAPGGYITCLDGRCQGQRKVLKVIEAREADDGEAS